MPTPKCQFFLSILILLLSYSKINAQVELKFNSLFFIYREYGLALETPLLKKSSLNFKISAYNPPKKPDPRPLIDFSNLFYHYHDAIFLSTEYRYYPEAIELQRKNWFYGGSLKYRYTYHEDFSEETLGDPSDLKSLRSVEISQTSYSLAIGFISGYKFKIRDHIFLEFYSQIGRYIMLNTVYSHGFDFEKQYPNKKRYDGDGIPRLDFRLLLNLNLRL
tara:strand:+ start:8969 stop:9625 length:657 start_codon:yes stop_codon:yes gene_type:complete